MLRTISNFECVKNTIRDKVPDKNEIWATFCGEKKLGIRHAAILAWILARTSQNLRTVVADVTATWLVPVVHQQESE